jgi:hypothetical protein
VHARRILTLSAALFFAASSSASAEWQFAPIIGYTFKGSTTIIDLQGTADDVHRHLGAAVSLLGAGPVGVEGIFLVTPSFFGGGDDINADLARVSSSRLTTLMGNVVLTTPRAWNEYGLRPFVSGGAGLIRSAQTPRENVLPFALNALGYNVGGGAVGFLSDSVGLRFDLRYFRMQPQDGQLDSGFPISLEERARLRFWTLSIGVVFRP